MNNQLAIKHTFASLLKFAMPSIIMMVFLSMYTMVDGVFVANFIDDNALASLNIVYPISSIIIGFGIMFSTGASAIIGKEMGENNYQKAKQVFSSIVVIGIIVGILISSITLLNIESIIKLLGANDAIYQYCYDYLSVLMLFAPMSILQLLFQFFFTTAGKPNYGLIVTILGGVANIVLDYVFIVNFDMGVQGAALATGIGYSIPALFGILYFSIFRGSTLNFVKFKFILSDLLKICSNGISEMVTNLAVAITTVMFNYYMMKFVGEQGIAAISIILYAQFLLTAIFMGYSSGIAPVISFNYGSKDYEQLRANFKYSIIFVVGASIIMFVTAFFAKGMIINIFASNEPEVFAIAYSGFDLFSICYLFAGINIFASSMFTALSNGWISAFISFCRSFVFIILSLLILPNVIDINGVYLAIPLAELLTMVVSIYCIVKLKDEYYYY